MRPVLNMFQQERSLLLFTHTAFALPSAPRLLLWLFLSNLGWFMALACIYGAQIQKNNGMHLENDTECTALSSTIFCFMTFSVLWPSIICFDLLQNTRLPNHENSPYRFLQHYLRQNFHCLHVTIKSSQEYDQTHMWVASLPMMKFC